MTTLAHWQRAVDEARRRRDSAGVDAALAAIVRLDPDAVLPLLELLQLRLGADRVDEAAALLPELTRRDPGGINTILATATIAERRQDFEAALAHYRQAFALAPALDAAPFGAARCLLTLGRAAEVLPLFDSVAARAGDSVPLWEALAAWSASAPALYPMLLRARRELVRLAPTDGVRRLLLGDAAIACGEFGVARESFDAAVRLDDRLLSALACSFQYPERQIHADEAAVERFRRQWDAGMTRLEARTIEDPRHAHDLPRLAAAPTPVYRHYLGGDTRAEQQRHANLIERVARALPHGGAAPRRTLRDGRRRIGLASPSLYAHTHSKLFHPLFEALPSARFELVCFHLGERVDQVSRRWAGHAAVFQHGPLDAVGWSRRIADAELDVLIFLDVAMQPVTQFLAAQRLAPVQCALWGFPVTSGSCHLDWFLSSDAMEPADGERHYRERLVRLPDLGCAPVTPTLAPDPEFQIAARRRPDAVHLLLAQSHFKLLPAFDAVLARILAALPDACLTVAPSAEPATAAALHGRLADALRAGGADTERQLVVHGRLPPRSFWALAADADLALDAHGWSGGLSTLELAWYGAPTLTLPGDVMRSRHGLAINRRLALPELIADSVDDYVARAVALAGDRARCAALRTTVLSRRERLFDGTEAVAAFVDFLGRPDLVIDR